MKTLAVIIARAGSKGLRNKNITILGGKPLAAWTIEHALASSQVDEVVVTTDSPEILTMAKEYGVHGYDRPTEFSHDTATVDSAARHGVQSWETEQSQNCNYVVILYANVAIRPTDLTDRAVAKLIETKCDSVQSVYPVGKMHPLWMRKLKGEDNDVLENYQPNEIYRRQDLPPVYMLNGGVIALTKQSLFDVQPNRPHAFLGDDRRGIITQADEVVDIDSQIDLFYAKAVLEAKAIES